MAGGGEGFFVPATIKVSLQGLPEVQQQLAAFAATAKTAAEGGAAPIDPTTGAQAGVDAMRRATGQALETANRAQAEIKKALGGDLTAEARASYEKLAKEIERNKDRIYKSTRAARTDETGVIQKPIYPPKPTPPRSVTERSYTSAQLESMSQGIDARSDLQKLADSYSERAELSRQIANNDEKILDIQIGMESDLARQREVYAKRLTGTPEGLQRLGDEARANVAEQNAALTRRKYEAAEVRGTGGIALRAGTQAVEAANAREISIEQTKIDIEQGNAAKMAEERVLRERLNRLVEEEVRKQQVLSEVADEILAKQRQRLAERAEVRARETPDDLQQVAQDKIDEAARLRDVSGRVRAGQDTGAIAAEQAAAVAAKREVSIKQSKIDLESGAAKSIAEQKVLQDQVNREVAKEVRALEDSVAIARETAADQKAREEQAARVTLERSGVDSSGYQGAQLTARAAVLKRAEADTAAAAAAQATTAAEIDAMAKRKVEESKVRAALQVRERELIKSQIQGGQIEGGTFFQRIQAGVKGTQGGAKLPTEYLTGGQFLAEKFTRTLGFAVSGGILAAFTTGIVTMFKEAMNLEKALTGVRGALNAMGQVDSFSGIRQDIIGISNDTGVAASEVAKASAAFLAMDQGDAATAMNDTSAAMKLMAITGQDLATTLSQVLPMQKAFGLTAEQVGDQVVKAADQYGTSGDDASKFLGKISGVGAILGKNSKEVVALGGNIRNAFGTTLEGSVEPINKAYDLISKNTDRLFKILASNPATKAANQDIAKAISQGDKSGAIIALQRASMQMNESQQNTLVTTMGTPQDAQIMVGVLQAAAATLRDVAKAEGEAGQSGGALASRFEEVKDSLARAFELIKNAFANIGDALLRSGVADALKDVATLLGVIVGAVSFVTSAFAGLNEATGGVLGRFAEMALVVTAIVKAQGLLAAAHKKVTTSTEEEDAATRGSVASKEADTVAAEQAALEEQRLAASRAEAAAAGEGAAESSATVAVGEEGETVAANEAALAEERLAAARVESAASGGAATEETVANTGRFAGGFGGMAGRSGFLKKAFSGGKFIKPEFAATEAAVDGAEASASGLMASPLLTGAIAVAGILAVKNKYDEMSQQVQAAGASLSSQLKTATDANVAKVAGMQPDWIDSFQSWLFREPTIQAKGQAEQSWRQAAPDLAQLGLAHYEPPKQSEKDASARQTKIDDAQKELNTGFAAFYSDIDKATLGAALQATDLGQKMALAAGATYVPTAGVSDTVHFDARTIDYEKLRASVMQDVPEAERATDEGKAKIDLQRKFAEVERGAPGHTPSQRLQDLQRTLGRDRNLKDLMATVGGDYDKAVGALSAWGEEQFTPFDELKAKLQSGRISQSTMLSEGQKSLDAARQAAAATSGTEKEAWLAAVADREKFLKDLVANNMLVDAAVQDKLDSVLSLAPKTNAAARHQTAMAGKSYADRLADLPNMISQDIESQQEQIAAITNPDQRLGALNKGVVVDPLTRQTQIEEQIDRDPTASAAVQKIATRANRSVEEVRKAIAKKAVERHMSVQEAAKEFLAEIAPPGEHGALLEKAISKESEAFSGISLPAETIAPTPEMQAMNEIRINAGKRVAALGVTLAKESHNKIATAADMAKEAADEYADAVAANKIDKSGVTDEKVQEALAKKIKADSDLADTLFDLAQLQKNRAVILANHDPVQENAAQMGIALSALAHAKQVNDPFAQEQAEQQILQLQQQAAENQRNIIRGAMAITQAKDAEDPLASAQDALKAAEYELANSHGEADREQKEAAVINARRGVQNAISAALSADAQLAITLANLHDDPVTAANVAAVEAKRKLDEAIAKGIKDRAVLAPLEAQVAETAKAAYLAPINKQISDLDYLYGLEQISLGDYIAGLEAELSALVYDSKEYRDLKLKIYNLKKSASTDLAWNLPGHLSLPTLYETRRASQTIFNTPSTPYQDNRNVSVQIDVNGAQDPMAVATQVQTALNDSLRGGPTYSASIPVAAGI